MTECEFSLKGYNMWHNLPDIDYGSSGRGVIIYTKATLQVNPESFNNAPESSFKDAKFISLRLNKGDKLLIGCIYRSPNSTLETKYA